VGNWKPRSDAWSKRHRIMILAITYAEMRFGVVGKKASPRYGQLVDAFCARLDTVLSWDPK